MRRSVHLARYYSVCVRRKYVLQRKDIPVPYVRAACSAATPWPYCCRRLSCQVCRVFSVLGRTCYQVAPHGHIITTSLPFLLASVVLLELSNAPPLGLRLHGYGNAVKGHATPEGR